MHPPILLAPMKTPKTPCFLIICFVYSEQVGEYLHILLTPKILLKTADKNI